MAPKCGSDGNCSGKFQLCRAAWQPQPASAGGNFNRSPQALTEPAAVGGRCRGRGTRLVVCSKPAGCTHAPRGVRWGSTPLGWGRTGSTLQGDLGEQGQIPVAQGWHPGSCRSRHIFLILLQSQRYFREPRNPAQILHTWILHNAPVSPLEVSSHHPGAHILVAQRWPLVGSSAAATSMEQEGQGSVVQMGSKERAQLIGIIAKTGEG